MTPLTSIFRWLQNTSRNMKVGVILQVFDYLLGAPDAPEILEYVIQLPRPAAHLPWQGVLTWCTLGSRRHKIDKTSLTVQCWAWETDAEAGAPEPTTPRREGFREILRLLTTWQIKFMFMGVFQISGLVNYTTEEFLIYREETEEKFSGLNCSFFHLYDHISLSHDLNPFLINLTQGSAHSAVRWEFHEIWLKLQTHF